MLCNEIPYSIFLVALLWSLNIEVEKGGLSPFVNLLLSHGLWNEMNKTDQYCSH